MLTWRPSQHMGVKVGPRDLTRLATVGQALESERGLWCQKAQGVLVEYKVYSFTNNGRIIIINPSSRTHSSTKRESVGLGTPSM